MTTHSNSIVVREVDANGFIIGVEVREEWDGTWSVSRRLNANQSSEIAGNIMSRDTAMELAEAANRFLNRPPEVEGRRARMDAFLQRLSTPEEDA